MQEGVSLKGVEAISVAIDVSDPARQILDGRLVVQQSVPAPLTCSFSCFCSCGFPGCAGLLGALPASSFIF